MRPSTSCTERTLGAARLMTFCAMMPSRRSAASVAPWTTSSTSGRHTSPWRGTMSAMTVFRPPNCRRIVLSISTSGWFAGRFASTLNSVRRLPMPSPIQPVASVTASKISQARRTRKRA